MTMRIVRGFFVFSCAIMGYLWAGYFLDPDGLLTAGEALAPMRVMGALSGAGIALVIFLFLHFITQEIYECIAPALVAIALAMLVGWALGNYILSFFPEASTTLSVFVTVSLVLVFGFIGISLGLTRASHFAMVISAVEKRNHHGASLKLVDTSAIIDGRIADVCETGFLDGTLVVPRFVLHELQHIADSSDMTRRTKGRHGLDILDRLQGDASRNKIEIIDDNPQSTEEVDEKLVILARKFHAKILTTDFNLNKVAKIEGLHVLNINDLANALKPLVLPDERLEVKIIKEGKEATQGVGYLDDGTMVVVDGGRPHQGKLVEALVTSVLQTAAGRMIFTRFSRLIT
jgi:uncharacterized protein YacL